MDKMIFLHVENRYLKRVLLKSIVGADLGILDIVDIDDFNFKLKAFGNRVCLVILEITDLNLDSIAVEIVSLKAKALPIPIMALVSKDTSDVVTFAMRNGIEDVLLLPKNRELYNKAIENKMAPFYAQFNYPQQGIPKENLLSEVIFDNPDIKESLNLEIKRAQRGRYSLSLVMAHINGEVADAVKGLFKRIETILRDTDKVLMVDDVTFIGVFPFTPKDYVPTIEQKFREAFQQEFGKPDHYRKLTLSTATYPYDETNLDSLLTRLENGIHNSTLIDSIKSPLNDLSKTEIENYKQKVRQYKKFF